MEMLFQCPHCNAEYQLPAAMSNSEAECPDCGEIITIPPLRLGPGVIVGGFRLERHLGQGSMGDVYLATQLSMDRRVAVKLLPQAMTVVEESVNRFLHEVQTSAKMEHPNIVTAFDAGQDNGTYYLAMSFVEGENFDDIVRREGSIPEEQAVEVCIAAAKGLKYAWEEYSLLHRDIKPGNIMVDRHGTIKLMDLGISKSIHEDASLTVPGLVVGTPHYMSPEQAWSEDPIDFRSDLYAVGATLYMLMTGRPPYQGSSQSVFTMLIRPEPFPDPQKLNPKMSDGMRALILTCMSKHPDDRYQSWDELIAEARRVAAGQMPLRGAPARTEEPADIPAPPGGSGALQQTPTKGTVSLTLKKKGPGTGIQPIAPAPPGPGSSTAGAGSLRPLKAAGSNAAPPPEMDANETVGAAPPAGSLLNNQGSRVRIEPKVRAGESKLRLAGQNRGAADADDVDDEDDASDDDPVAGGAERLEPKSNPGESKLRLSAAPKNLDGAAPAAAPASGQGSATRMEPKVAAGASKLKMRKNEPTKLAEPPDGIAAAKAPPVSAPQAGAKPKADKSGGGKKMGAIVGPLLIGALAVVLAIVYVLVTREPETPVDNGVATIPVRPVNPTTPTPPESRPNIPDLPNRNDPPPSTPTTTPPTQPPATPTMTPEQLAAERREIEATIATRVAAQLVSNAVSAEAVARRLGLGWPVQQPSHTMEEIQAMVPDRAKQLAINKFPDRNVKVEAENRFGHIGLGEYINVEYTQNGKTINTGGILKHATASRIQVGETIIERALLPQETRDRLDPAAAQKNVESFIAAEAKKTQDARDAYALRIQQPLTEELYKQAGYVERDDKWVSPKALLDTTIEKDEQKAKTRITNQVTAAVYKEYGYVKQDNTWVKSP